MAIAWDGQPGEESDFRDPDNNLLEFITMLPDEPRPDLGVLPWSDWIRRKGTDWLINFECTWFVLPRVFSEKLVKPAGIDKGENAS